MKEWFDVYPECPYFSQKLVSEDIFGHDSFEYFCSKTGEKKDLYPRIHCKNCEFTKDMDLLIKLVNESKE